MAFLLSESPLPHPQTLQHVEVHKAPTELSSIVCMCYAHSAQTPSHLLTPVLHGTKLVPLHRGSLWPWKWESGFAPIYYFRLTLEMLSH